MQRLAMRILKSRNLQEILLLITHETKQLLGADICGIMLREGDAVVMQRCVGNFSADTASLRAAAGGGAHLPGACSRRRNLVTSSTTSRAT